MEEIITLKEGSEENPVLIVTSPVTREVPLETLEKQRDGLKKQRAIIDKRIKKIDSTISKAKEVIDDQGV